MPPQKPPGHGMRFGKIIKEVIPRKPKTTRRKKLRGFGKKK